MEKRSAFFLICGIGMIALGLFFLNNFELTGNAISVPGLFAYYPLDSAFYSGNDYITQDSVEKYSTYGFYGVLTYADFFNDSERGNVLRLSGSGTKMVANSPGYFNFDEMTVCGWVKHNDPSGSNQGTLLTLGTPFGNDFDYSFDFDSGNARFSISDGYGGFDRVLAPIGDNEWHYWCGSFNAFELKIYKDGLLINSAPKTKNVRGTYQQWIVGANSPEGLEGYVDNLRVYEVVLNESDILSLFLDEGGVLGVPSVSTPGCVSGPDDEGKVFVCTWNDLNQIRDNLNGKYVLGRDLLTSDADYSYFNSGSGFGPLGSGSTRFSGSFDGDGFIIQGLIINRTNSTYSGLFGSVASSGIIENLGLVSPVIFGDSLVGGLVGFNEGRISKSYVSNGRVSGSTYVGGLIGQNYGTLENSYFNGGEIKAGQYPCGGLIAFNNGLLNTSYFVGDVYGDNVGQSISGLVGRNSGKVLNSFVNARIFGTASRGSLIGQFDGGLLTNCYWINSSENPSNCFAFSNRVSSNENCSIVALDFFQGGISGNALFSSWDFANIWSELSSSYPVLVFQVGASVDTPSGGDVGESSGDSADGDFYENSFSVSVLDFESGYTKYLEEREKLDFKINNVNHYVGVRGIYSSSVTIEVASDPQIKVLSKGQSWEVEVTGDDYYDVLVTIKNLTSSKVELTIKQISKKIPSSVTGTSDSGKTDSSISKSSVSSGNFDWAMIGIVFGILFLFGGVVIVVFVVLLGRKNKDQFSEESISAPLQNISVPDLNSPSSY